MATAQRPDYRLVTAEAADDLGERGQPTAMSGDLDLKQSLGRARLGWDDQTGKRPLMFVGYGYGVVGANRTIPQWGGQASCARYVEPRCFHHYGPMPSAEALESW